MVARKNARGMCVGTKGGFPLPCPRRAALHKQGRPRANAGLCTQQGASESSSEFYQVHLAELSGVGGSTQAEPLYRRWRGGEELCTERKSVASTI